MINKKREKLIELGIILNNLTDPRLIKLSEELDRMIIEYQKMCLGSKKHASNSVPYF
ncbi:aspartyl-phosphate phosphatase Spo0E family protein [Fictibacillus sp. BK138]|uniref:aspartyl-phosphate phosphatase Spo0E family protein n=1 Tax=Fictibacillus sp. BK138 TaxID=2512121 RepID=UPI00102926A1|nr:aspartyl-phosphate phosphatase Spo0E family protein [Fictibacillus sp. BK138]